LKDLESVGQIIRERSLDLLQKFTLVFTTRTGPALRQPDLERVAVLLKADSVRRVLPQVEPETKVLFSLRMAASR
jgi:hypothetical protein